MFVSMDCHDIFNKWYNKGITIYNFFLYMYRGCIKKKGL
jgi:hypothetical protein